MAGIVFITAANAAADANAPDKSAEAITELTHPQSMIEIGAGYVSDDFFAPGNYTGLYQKGGFAIGNFDLRGGEYSYGNPGDDKTRWRLIGTNLGLSSRSLSGEYGRQGAYRITFGYDELSRVYSDSYQTPYLGAGSERLTLPAAFVRAADTGGMSALASSMQPYEVESTRRRAVIGFSTRLTPEWELKAGLRNDDREGTRIRGMEFGSNGGNARATLLPEPIDSSTQLLDMSLAFNGEDHRFSLAYHGSLFKNHISAFSWQNAYSSAPWVGGGSGLPPNYPLPNGQAGVAPDNQFHQFALNGSYDFSATTRLTVTATRGRMTQNEVFLPYTINPGLTTTGLPRDALEGRVDTTFLNVRLAMRPMRNLNISASLRYEERDNRTPVSEYIYIGGDIQLQPAPGANSDRIRTNLPRSRRQQQLMLEADYRLSPSTAIKAGWDYDDIERTYAEVEQVTENTYRLELRHGGTGQWNANASLAWLLRRGSQYLANLPYLSSYTSAAYINGLLAANGCTLPIECVRRGPLPKKFYMADRDRERARLIIGYLPDAAVSLQMRLDVNRDRYPETTYGVTEAQSWSAGADLGFVFNEHFSGTLFYNYEDQRSQERSRQLGGGNAASSANADWVNRLIDQPSSIGVGLRHKGLLDGKLELSADAIVVRGRTRISTSVGPAVPPGQNPAAPLPDLIANSENINIGARYALDRHSTVRIGYLYRRISNSDWALRQVGAATMPGLIGTLENSANDDMHAIGVSFIRSFR